MSLLGYGDGVIKGHLSLLGEKAYTLLLGGFLGFLEP